MRTARWSVLLLVLVCTACAPQLDTTYAKPKAGSVNGVSVFTRLVEQRLDPASVGMLGSRTADHYDTLLHLAAGREPPSEEAMASIQAWLDAASGRQFLLVLRDGAVAAWLLDRWLSEIRTLRDEVAGDERERLDDLAEALRQRRAEEFEPMVLGPGNRRDYGEWSLEGHRPLEPQRLTGAIDAPAPPMMRVRSTLAGERLRPLVLADGVVWLGAIERGGSRLLVAVNATPLLDAALVDPDARRLASVVIDELEAGHDGRAAWVRWLRQGESVPPSIIRQLFATPPFSYPALHLLVLLLAFAWFKAAWLGRVNPGRGNGVERFARHVDGLAWRLRKRDAWRECLRALGRSVGRDAPAARDEQTARRAAIDLLAPGRGADTASEGDQRS